MTTQPHALVTGVSSGIGAAITQRLLAEGWRVTGLSRRPPEQSNPALTWIGVDLADDQALDTVLTDIGPLDAIVHAAGFMRTAPLGALDPADGAAMWHLHVAVASRLVDRLIERLATGGRIVLIGSRTMQGAAGRSQYAATKAALVGLVRSWALELAGRGITVNLVAPGATETPMLRDPGRAGTPPRLPPLGRYVQPAEVAGLTAFLLGPDAGALTGQTLTVCGGASL
ncbi:SDR family NAD(P)-dependent oxidoreductase [Pseudomonas oryzihabitans]|uniref:3-oxoacyl-[acyl-carrier protein] reductase n=1 Tax=Pseudomonas oryzihabitans TaxID=47885 RepID=A0AAJ2EUP5_9PSED|nr:SDR family oxidoreductase [Pseudomonas psychrotolerans]MDR6232814.1 3-oxoacyl-[acyl-carrier protein] reductase [Pseudomonas psychrotolerans]MDR6358247.1 3-oxoacyl-[acyl-carrier protein] reductase [Pseudomonas psychrotolerans]